MGKLRILDLFSGIGGFSKGLEDTGGFETVAFCEIEDYPRRVLRKHWPDVPIHRDIRELDGSKIYADVITGGFPCQPFSIAGKRRGQNDDRNLWPEMLRVISEAKPTWVIGENTAGITSMELADHITTVEDRTIIQGPDYDLYTAQIIREADMLLDELCCELEEEGYQVLPLLVPACAVDAHHGRGRVWIMANASSGRLGESEEGKIQQPGGAEIIGTGSIANTNSGGSKQPRAKLSEESNLNVEKRDTLADSSWIQPRRQDKRAERERVGKSGESITLSHTNIVNDDNGRHGTGTVRRERPQEAELPGSKSLSNNGCGSSEGTRPGQRGCKEPSRWEPEPGVGRVANGIPSRVDRLKGLGNAVVPQVVEMIGYAILEAENGK